MQDEALIRAEEAGEWLREHFKDDPAPRVEITWTVREAPNPAALAWVLDTLFAPRPDDQAA
ncbi:hypothetical protein ABZY09_30740 [Streptomyces sp. NPDC002928]|uniref:hypothetical protein n=1 Tax=Streptomyces sp. NPDC002928 TaxID=3154440 RepID=UPI0033B6FBFF